MSATATKSKASRSTIPAGAAEWVVHIFKFELRVTNREFANDVKALEFDEFTFALFLRVLKSRNSKLYDTFNKYYDRVCERSVAVAPVKQDVVKNGRFKKR